MKNLKGICLLSTLVISILTGLYVSLLTISAQVTNSVSYPLSYTLKLDRDKSKDLMKNKLLPGDIATEKGILDKENNYYYYTKKSPVSWGSEKYIFVYSISSQQIVKQIEFDNTGYFKYPISLSPDSQYIILAERAHGVGEVNITGIDLITSKAQMKHKVFAPVINWPSNRVYSFLSVEEDCTKKCKAESLYLNEFDVKEMALKKKDLVSRIDKGVFPQINKMYTENNYTKLETLDLNVISIKNE
jgi:hypothetical protein